MKIVIKYCFLFIVAMSSFSVNAEINFDSASAEEKESLVGQLKGMGLSNEQILQIVPELKSQDISAASVQSGLGVRICKQVCRGSYDFNLLACNLRIFGVGACKRGAKFVFDTCEKACNL